MSAIRLETIAVPPYPTSGKGYTDVESVLTNS